MATTCQTISDPGPGILVLLTPSFQSCYHAYFVGVKMQTHRGLLLTGHSSIPWALPTSLGQSIWVGLDARAQQGERDDLCFLPSRFMPSFLRLGSWNVVMFVTYEQLKRALAAACASQDAPF